MIGYVHVVTGAHVSVRDDKVMDSSWRRIGEGSTESEGYERMKVADLRAEIERRNNDGREDADRLSDEGRKPDLIAALQADDNR